MTLPAEHDPVRVRFRKWVDRPHWEYDAQVLGHDDHGVWIGARAGTTVARPGVSFEARAPFVSLVPPDAGFVATFYGEHHEATLHDPVELYVDITTVPVWSPDAVTTVDLDLDVVRCRSGRIWVDDDDEFADHRVRLAYPDDLVEHAVRWCDRVQRAVAGEQPRLRPDLGPDLSPDLGRQWLHRLATAPA